MKIKELIEFHAKLSSLESKMNTNMLHITQKLKKEIQYQIGHLILNLKGEDE